MRAISHTIILGQLLVTAGGLLIYCSLAKLAAAPQPGAWGEYAHEYRWS